jgi:hypothetical protein
MATINPNDAAFSKSAFYHPDGGIGDGNKMMTAVEWYNSKIKKLEFWVETKQITWKQYHMEKDKLIEQTKEMEKEQILQSYNQGYRNGELDESNLFPINRKR